jgi:type III pantothenate kinase
MLLCIDCGNTNTVFAVWDGERFLATFRTSTEWQRTADQYFVWLAALMAHKGIPLEIGEVIISSTVPRVVFNLRVLSDRYFGTRPLVVGKPECLLPAPPRVDPWDAGRPGPAREHDGRLRPARGRPDRGGFRHRHDLRRDGGGRRLCGRRDRAGREPEPRGAAPGGGGAAACGRDETGAGHRDEHGRLHAVGRVLGLHRADARHLRRIKEEYGRPMRIIGTGGLAPLFSQGDVLFDSVEDDLTMHGLTVIHRYNKENGSI